MGEVYRARDTRLNRSVAIKVLPAHFADEPAVRQRFEREDHAVSSLNHPHICTLWNTQVLAQVVEILPRLCSQVFPAIPLKPAFY